MMSEQRSAPVLVDVKTLVVSFASDFFAGGVASGFTKSAMAPIERAKLLLQVQWVHTDIPPERRYNGLSDCIRRVYKEQGLLSFWRGNTVNIARHIPSQALNFSLRDRFRELFGLDTVPIDHFWKFLGLSMLSGASSGAVCLSVLYPLDFARTRVGTDVRSSGNRQFRGSLDCLRQAYSTVGLRGIYRGFDVAVLGVGAWRALYFGLYDTFTTRLLGGRQGGTLQERWAVAQMATSTAGTIIYPIDSVRRRMMMETGRKERMYKSSFHCFRTMVATEGYRGFYRGLSANLIRGMGTSILLVLYDEIRALMEATH
ncbi:mitochondrial ADP/ATP translocator [Ectocarpus siliculosus]|uniref:ADP/ATP translocase n=1 Tax=Ectocarpus siliculosus TaxID=2880 RepID=D7FW17_ECTSI|nr:mitochondrial ADP/ATP translocator [Ectocarpus siliculosus]|eukprot:CBJ25537.1 mitochondrial ADP/ATP translocator [Ectocarpus siliculosus]